MASLFIYDDDYDDDGDGDGDGDGDDGDDDDDDAGGGGDDDDDMYIYWWFWWSAKHPFPSSFKFQLRNGEDLGYSTDCQPAFFCTNRRGCAPHFVFGIIL